MSDESPAPHAGDDQLAPTPRWVLVCGAVLVVLVVIFAALHLTGRGLGGHGA